jgi:hypothetical protein
MSTENVIDITNAALLLKVETTVCEDAEPGASDAIPFETDGYSYNHPFVGEASNEATGTKVAGAPLIVGQPAEITIRFRLKGANAAYTSSVKPPHHALYTICGWRGLFTAAVAAAALTAGTTTTATLGAGFSTTTRAYLGMPLIMSGVAGGAHPLVVEYTSGKVATLSDEFADALDTTSSAALPANWTYAGTSPQSADDRTTDEPTGTLYIYEDGNLLKFVGCRGTIEDIAADVSKPGFGTAKLMGIYAGRTAAAIPDGISIPGHSAPTLVQGPSGISPAFSLNRKPLAISSFSLKDMAELSSLEDPNTNYGFGPGQIGGRSPMLSCDPLQTHVNVRDTLADLAAATQFPGAIRFLGVAGNRIAITLPLAQTNKSDPALRGKKRSEQNEYRLLTNGRDAQDRTTEKLICFY